MTSTSTQAPAAIQYRAITSIQPYGNNPRINVDAVAGLKDSIQQYGFLVPLVIDSDGVIITGHTRYLASVELGYDELPCIIADHLTPDQVKAFRIADNRVSENSKWDEGKLSEELRALQSMGFDLGFTGFSAAELDCLCGQISATCLDELDYKAVCGDVAEQIMQAAATIVVRVGASYSFQVPVAVYQEWEKRTLAQYPKKSQVADFILDRLGFKELLLAHQKVTESQLEK